MLRNGRENGKKKLRGSPKRLRKSTEFQKKNMYRHKDKSQLLSLRLKQWNLLQADTRTYFLKYREKGFSELFS